MFIDRNSFHSGVARSSFQLKEACIGCKDCKGACSDLLELLQIPSLVLGRKDNLS